MTQRTACKNQWLTKTECSTKNINHEVQIEREKLNVYTECSTIERDEQYSTSGLPHESPPCWSAS